MASLIKKGNKYGLIWTDRNREQSQTRESLKTSNKKDAERLKAKLEHQYWEGRHDPWKHKWYQKPSETDVLNLFDAVEEFITFKTDARGPQGWSKTTAKNETLFMRMFRDWIGADRALKSITEADIENFYYRDEVGSDHTRNSYYISLNTFFNWCIIKEYIQEKPIYKPKKPQRKIPKFIYPEELAQLIEYRLSVIRQDIDGNALYDTNRHVYWVILGWMVLAGTGMRPAELANLKLQQIEPDSILIGEDFTTKVREERRVPLLFESRQAIKLLRDPNFRKREPFMSKSDYLLGRSPHTSRNRLSREFSLAWKTRFPNKAKRTLYNLKDMFAVRYLTDASISESPGLKINSLKEILGHASLETTQKYLKAVPTGISIDGTIWDYKPEKVWPMPQ